MIAPLLVFVAIAWVAVLVATPLLPAVPAAFLYVLGSRICHQIAARSFHVDGAQLPVCARCTGIYAGLAIGALYATFATAIHRGQTPRGLTPGSDPITSGHWGLTPARWVLLVGALPTLVTVLAEWTGLWQTSNVVRAIAGAPLGIAVGVVVIAALTARPGLHYGECAPRPPIGRDRPPSHI